MVVLHRFKTEPQACAYLSGRSATMDYTVIQALSDSEYERLMNNGCRKFGAALFKPVCAGCQACRPIRVPVALFRPDRSQRRAWNGNRDLRVELAPPTCDKQRLDLFARYHEAQQASKSWPGNDCSEESYYWSFVSNPTPSIEVSLWEGETLRGIMIADVTPNVISGVYHYYEPGLPQRSLGTCCILHCFDLAQKLKKQWVYLGFFVSGCRSMAYKSHFKPCEVMDVNGVWHALQE